jgi:hypothetical protein
MKDLGHVEDWVVVPMLFREHVEKIKNGHSRHQTKMMSFSDAQTGQIYSRMVCSTCLITWIPGHDDTASVFISNKSHGQ